MSMSLFTSFRGRIGRGAFWMGFIIVVAMSIAGEIYFEPELLSSTATPQPVSPLASTLWSVFWLIPSTAIAVKRFNDCDRPWWLAYALSAFWLLAMAGPHVGVFIGPDAALPHAVAFWLLLLSALIATIDNGFTRGSAGPNRYGPAPVRPTLAMSTAQVWRLPGCA